MKKLWNVLKSTFYFQMKCLLLWDAVDLYLYRCPIAMDPIQNCTIVHTATYDAEFMTMCKVPIALPGTTTQIPTEIGTTGSPVLSPTPAVDTAPAPLSTHAPPEEETNSTTPWSASPSPAVGFSGTTTTFPSVPQSTTTTPHPNRHPSPTPSNQVNDSRPVFIVSPSAPSSYSSPTATVESTNDLLVVSIVISSVAIFLVLSALAFGGWKFYRHKQRKLVRPSIVEAGNAQNSWHQNRPTTRANTKQPLKPVIPTLSNEALTPMTKPPPVLTTKIVSTKPPPAQAPHVKTPPAPSVNRNDKPLIEMRKVASVHQIAKKFDPLHTKHRRPPPQPNDTI